VIILHGFSAINGCKTQVRPSIAKADHYTNVRETGDEKHEAIVERNVASDACRRQCIAGDTRWLILSTLGTSIHTNVTENAPEAFSGALTNVE